MPYDPNATWTAATNSGALEPVYYIVISGLAARHYSTGPVLSPSAQKYLVLQTPDSVSQKLAQLQGRSSLTLTDLRLVDAAGIITEIIATERASPIFDTLLNRTVVVYSGYRAIPESAYAPVFEGQIDALSFDGSATYTLRLVDIRRTANDEIMVNADASGTIPIATTLASGASAGALAFAVVSSVNITEGAYLMLGPNATGDEDKVYVGSVVGGTIFIGAVTEGVAAVPLAHTYAAGADVRWASTIIEGHPLNILYAVLTGEFTNPLFPLVRAQGLPTGMGLSPSSVKTADIVADRDRWSTGEVWRFEFRSSAAGFRFIEQKISRLLGYTSVTQDGLETFRAYRPPFPEVAGAGLPTITKNDVLEWEWVRAHDLHVNRVSLGVDLDPQSGAPGTTVTVEDTADQASTAETAEMADDDTGLRSSLNGISLAQQYGEGLLRRFKKPPDQFRVTLGLRRRALSVGDVVSVTHPDFPNIRTGFRGVTAYRLEVVERQESMAEGRVKLLLQDAGFIRPAAWAPESGAASYTVATAAEKEYAAWGPESGDFADGGRPYEWA